MSEPSGTPVERPGFSHRRERHGLIGPFGGRQLGLAALIVAAVAVALVALTTPLGNTGGTGRTDPRATPYLLGPELVGLAPGQRAPDFAGTRSDGSQFQLTDLDGRPIRLEDLRGKAVWVNFWASWCPPCKAETPILRDMAATYRDRGLVVVGISVQETNEADVRAYAERYELGYTVAADLRADVFRLYRVWALPTQFFIRPDGTIASVILAPLDTPGAVAQIEAILPAD